MADAIYTPVLGGTSINTAPMTNSSTPGQSQFQQLFSDPNFLNLLAGIGSRLDPQGVGGALGGATIAYNRAKAEQNFAQDNLKSTTPPTKLTPEGVAGPTSRTITHNADNTYTSTEKGDLPASEGSTVPTNTIPPVTESPLPSRSTNYLPRTSTQLSDLPFLLASQGRTYDLRGMTAEDVPVMMHMYNESERTRQSNIGQILNAYNIESEISAREKGPTEFEQQQAERLRLTNPGAAEAQAALSALNRAAAGGTATRTAAEQYALEQQRALGDLPVQIMQQQVQRARDIHGTYTPVTMPDGSTVLMTGAEIAQIERWQNEDATKLLDIATKNEAAILGKDDNNNPQIKDPRVIANIDEFNASSNKPYIYHWDEKKKSGAKLPIPLIRRYGVTRQLTAREVSTITQFIQPSMTPAEYITEELSKWAVKK